LDPDRDCEFEADRDPDDFPPNTPPNDGTLLSFELLALWLCDEELDEDRDAAYVDGKRLELLTEPEATNDEPGDCIIEPPIDPSDCIMDAFGDGLVAINALEFVVVFFFCLCDPNWYDVSRELLPTNDAPPVVFVGDVDDEE